AYFEIWREGKEVNKMGYVGFEVRRSDAAKVTTIITQRVFEMLLKEGKGKEEVMGYVNEEIRKIKSNHYSYEEIAFPKSLTDDFENYKVQTFHVKAAQWSNKHLGTSFKKGSKMKIIYGHINGLPTCDAFAFINNKQLEGKKININWEKMVEVLVDNKVNRIYSALGWNGTKQKTLF
ncbi:MAG: DNA polymerase domain-containing protein, partial [Nanoarchaeota archaeon]